MYNGFLMPQIGYIKRFEFEDLGLKFVKEKIELNTPIPLFTLVLIKDVYFKLEVVDLVTINLTLSGDRDVVDLQRPFHSTTSNLKGELSEYKINMRDILNIRSEFNSKPNEYDNVLSFSRRDYRIFDLDNEFYTF